MDLLVFDPAHPTEARKDEHDGDVKGLSKRKRKKLERQKEAEKSKAASEKVVADSRFDKLLSDARFSRDPTSSQFDHKAPSNKIIHETREKMGPKHDKGQTDADGTMKAMVEKIKGRAASFTANEKKSKK